MSIHSLNYLVHVLSKVSNISSHIGYICTALGICTAQVPPVQLSEYLRPLCFVKQPF